MTRTHVTKLQFGRLLTWVLDFGNSIIRIILFHSDRVYQTERHQNMNEHVDVTTRRIPRRKIVVIGAAALTIAVGLIVVVAFGSGNDNGDSVGVAGAAGIPTIFIDTPTSDGYAVKKAYFQNL